MHRNCVLKVRFVAVFYGLFPSASFVLSLVKKKQVTVPDFCQTSIGRMKAVMEVPPIRATGSLYT